MPTEAETCIERLEYLHSEAKKELRGMNQDALNWKPPVADTNSPYAIVTHMCGTEAAWVHEFVGGMKLERQRESEFAAKGVSVQELVTLLDSTSETTRRVLRNMTSDDLSQMKPPSPGREQVTFRWAVIHSIEHLGQHLGHLSLTRQLYRARERFRPA